MSSSQAFSNRVESRLSRAQAVLSAQAPRLINKHSQERTCRDGRTRSISVGRRRRTMTWASLKLPTTSTSSQLSARAPPTSSKVKPQAA